MLSFFSLSIKFQSKSIYLNKIKCFSKHIPVNGNFRKNFSFFLNLPNRPSRFHNFEKGKMSRNKKKRTTLLGYILIFLSFLGFLETFYLTTSKIYEPLIICSNENCSIVLNSVFSYFLDIPLSLFGIFLYFLSGFQIFNFLENYKNVNSKNNLLDITITTFPLLLGFFSSYFVYVLEKILKTSCPWCFFSIFLSGLILTLFSGISMGEKNFEFKSFIFLISVSFFFTYCINILNIIELQNFRG
jgi:uncharacterized membrane protein